MDRPDVEGLEKLGWLKFEKEMPGDNFEGGSESVESLAAWIRHLEEQRRWVPVGERLPDDDKIYLLCLSGGRIVVADIYAWSEGKYTHRWPSTVTHWQPLPEAPEVPK
jgi:hypothetical protein